jgi:hypothetical protein
MQDHELAIYKPYAEFKLDFSSKQRIHNLRQKLHHAHTILLNTVDIVVAVGAHEEKLFKTHGIETSFHEAFQQDILNISGEVRNYARIAQKLLDVSDNIRMLVSLAFFAPDVFPKPIGWY